MEWQTRINSALGHKRTLPLLVPISAVTQTNDDAVGATAGNQREYQRLSVSFVATFCVLVFASC